MFFNRFVQINNVFLNGGFYNMFPPTMSIGNPFFQFRMPVFQFQPQIFNFFESGYNNTCENFDTFESRTSNTNPLQNYNSYKGNLLAGIALNRAIGKTGYCAKFVQEAISLAGLGSLTTVNANEMATVLRSNPNFKEIPRDSDTNSLPAGCILVYDKFVRSPDEAWGHTEILTNDGRGVSDGITNSLNPNPSAIFIPV